MAAVWKLYKELASSVSCSHSVNINTHIATAYRQHGLHRHLHKGLTYTDMDRHTQSQNTHMYHLLSPGGKQRTERTLCSVNFWPVPFEDLLSRLFIYFYAGRAKCSLSLSVTLVLSLCRSFPPSLSPPSTLVLLPHY